jgi:hypothetical protein
MRRCAALAAVCLVFLVSAIRALEPSTADDGVAYIRYTDAELDHLFAFAKKSHFDFRTDFDRAQDGDKDAAKESLGRMFRLSVVFHRLDNDARTYGQIIWNSLLNLGETWGVEEYSKVIDKQAPDVQQRVRDFLYYPMTLAPKEQREETVSWARRAYPTLFPANFQFGNHDPLFARGTHTGTQ